MKKNLVKGFTLAEVLITLAIIGTVAAITIPQLIIRHEKKTTIVKLKKTYSILSQAFQRALVDYGEMDLWGMVDNDADSTEESVKKILPYIKTIHTCKNEAGCAAYPIYYLNGNVYHEKRDNTFYDYGIVLADGVSVRFDIIGQNADTMLIDVDINGISKPNTFGKDIFRFQVNKNQLQGYGEPSTCKLSGTGQGCAKKIMKDSWRIRYY